MKKVINIYGTGRCGSTLLDLILGNDPRGFSLGEVVNWFRPWRTTHFDIHCACGVYPCPVWESLKGLSPKSFHEQALEVLDVEFLVDSSKNLPWAIDNNIRGHQTQRYQPLNVLVYKEPVSLFYSSWKRDKSTSISTVARAYRAYEIFFESNMSFVAVNYDELVSNVSEVVRVMSDVLDIPYYPGKEEFWRKEHHHLYGAFSVREQLFVKEPRIKPTVYSDEFNSIREQVESDMTSRSELAEVVKILNQNNVLHISSYPEITCPEDIRKDWNAYYKSRWKRYLKRFCPDYHPDKEASLTTNYSPRS